MTKGSSAAALLALVVASGCCSSLDKLVDRSLVVAPHATAYHLIAGSARVIESSVVWHDAARNRDVPVKIYAPDSSAAAPVIVFSHGIGEDRDSYAYLGRAWAAHGYVVVHVTHAGTDKAMLRTGYWHLYQATKNPENWSNRPLDVSFVLDQLAAHATGTPPNADLTRVAVAGHSAGAFTALASSGLQVSGGSLRADPRVRVALALSMPKMGNVIPANGYDALAVPTLHMTGTCDASLIYRTRPIDRRAPFVGTHATKQYLVTMRDVNHDTFSNAEDEHHPRIIEITTAFLDAFLRDDADARRWFDDGGLAPYAPADLALERK